MLARPYRLTTTSEFKLVKEKGHNISSKNFTLSVYNRQDENPTRFGFVIPAKVFSTAVDRNRIKRVLSEATRHQYSYIKPGYDCVFLPKSSMLSAYAADTMQEVKDIFVKAKILK